MRVSEMNREALEAFQAQCQKEYAAFQAEGLKLDMSRGKPAPKQLDLTNGILTCLSEEDYRAENGLDCRNYGCLDGLPEAKAFFAPMLRKAGGRDRLRQLQPEYHVLGNVPRYDQRCDGQQAVGQVR